MKVSPKKVQEIIRSLKALKRFLENSHGKRLTRTFEILPPRPVAAILADTLKAMEEAKNSLPDESRSGFDGFREHLQESVVGLEQGAEVDLSAAKDDLTAELVALIDQAEEHLEDVLEHSRELSADQKQSFDLLGWMIGILLSLVFANPALAVLIIAIKEILKLLNRLMNQPNR